MSDSVIGMIEIYTLLALSALLTSDLSTEVMSDSVIGMIEIYTLLALSALLTSHLSTEVQEGDVDTDQTCRKEWRG